MKKTLKYAREQWSKARKRYVVGYLRHGNCLYSTPLGGEKGFHGHEGSLPFTLKEANTLLEEMPSPNAAIFELRPVAINKRRRSAF